MDVTKVPFVEKIGIVRGADDILRLPYNESMQNHLQTIHAGAQFVLAETASGEALQKLFPELVGKVIPVLRDSNIKYKKSAIKSITAHPAITDDAVVKFKEQFEKKGRASISVDVEIKDQDDFVTSAGIFNWFVQSIV